MKFLNDELPDMLDADVPIEGEIFIDMEEEDSTAFHHQDDIPCPDPTCPCHSGS
jgi:hypothetical protein